MKTSENINELAAALAAAQGKIASAVKDKQNSYLKNRYASLDSIWDACRGPLSENGLAISQWPSVNGDHLVMSQMLLHSSGQFIEFDPLTIKLEKINAQGVGIAITYARRYMLAAAVGVTADEDNDAQDISSEATKDKEPPPPPPDPGMTGEKLLFNLNRVKKIRGFYQSPNEIAEALSLEDWPAPDDVDGWRNLFVEARGHVLEITEDDEAAAAPAPWRPTKVEFFEQAASHFGLSVNDIADELKEKGFDGYDVDKAGAMWAALEAAQKEAQVDDQVPF